MADQNNDSRYKVARLLEKYGLEGIGEELEDRWTRSENRQGLRQLADYFNRRLLHATLTQDGTEPLKGEVENLYRLLTDEDISSGVQAQTQNKLQQQGINIEELKSDFVSHQSIYTYLTEHREVKPPNETPSQQDQLDKRLNTIQRLKTRLISVTERSLTELANSNHLTLGDFKVFVTVHVQCTDCDTRLPITELFSNGGCDCTPTTPD